MNATRSVLDNITARQDDPTRTTGPEPFTLNPGTWDVQPARIEERYLAQAEEGSSSEAGQRSDLLSISAYLSEAETNSQCHESDASSLLSDDEDDSEENAIGNSLSQDANFYARNAQKDSSESSRDSQELEARTAFTVDMNFDRLHRALCKNRMAESMKRASHVAANCMSGCMQKLHMHVDPVMLKGVSKAIVKSSSATEQDSLTQEAEIQSQSEVKMLTKAKDLAKGLFFRHVGSQQTGSYVAHFRSTRLGSKILRISLVEFEDFRRAVWGMGFRSFLFEDRGQDKLRQLVLVDEGATFSCKCIPRNVITMGLTTLASAPVSERL
jgi:hypothetical protein